MHRNLVAAWGLTVITIWALAFWLASSTVSEAGAHRTPVETLSTWDGEHFADVAQHGYSTAPGLETTFAFFPLLPAVSRVLGGPSHAPLAGILLNQILLLGSLVLLSILAGTDKMVPLRKNPSFWLLVSPLSFFLSVYYAEPLFLFLTLASVVAYRREKFVVAFAAGFLAGAARPTSITLPALFLWDVFSRQRRGTLSFAHVAVALAPWAGLGTYLAYVGYRMGDPLAYPHIHSNAWDRAWSAPFRPILRQAHALWHTVITTGHGDIDQWVRVFSTAATLALLAWGWKKIDRGFLLYTVATLLFVHSQFPFGMTARYEMVLFPLFILISLSFLSRPLVAPLAAGAMGALQAMLLLRHMSRLWVS